MKFEKLLMRLALAECRAAGAPADRVDVAAAVVADRLKLVERRGHAFVQVLDKAGNPRIASAHGDDLDVSAWVAEVAKARPMFFRPTPEAETASTVTTPDTTKTTTPTTAEAVRLKVEQDAQEVRSAAAERASWPNPWRAETVNMTRQMVLTNLEPDRATRLRTAAGVA